MTLKVSQKPLGRPSSFLASSRCPVEETGMNSVAFDQAEDDGCDPVRHGATPWDEVGGSRATNRVNFQFIHF